MAFWLRSYSLCCTMPERSWSFPKHFCPTSEHFCNMWCLWNRGYCCEMCFQEAVLAVGTCGMVLERVCGHRQQSDPSSSTYTVALSWCTHGASLLKKQPGTPVSRRISFCTCKTSIMQFPRSFWKDLHPLCISARSPAHLSLASLGECAHWGETTACFHQMAQNQKWM